jgi:small subunit ribosomal protein S8
MTDPIADMLTRVRNATLARHARVDIPMSSVKVEIAKVLESEGYVKKFTLVERPASLGKRMERIIRIWLKYGPRGERVITGIQRISRPGQRVYFKKDSVPAVLSGLGINVLTTSRGVMTGRNAVRSGIGGEVLCNVW